MKGMRGICPVHDYERQLCTDYCLPERVLLQLLTQEFAHYWNDRARGVKPRRTTGVGGNLRRETVPTLEPNSSDSGARAA